MKIAQIAPFEEPVPPKKYGGTERIVYHLTEELIKKGHKVTLFATGDSKTSAKLLPIFPRALRSIKIGQNLKARDAYKLIGLAKVIEILLKENFDIIHNHIGWRFLPFIKILKTKVVTTLHGPLNIGYQRFIYQEFPNSYYISISKNQREPLPKLNFVGNVYNGINITSFPFKEKSGNYLAFLGRMSPEKGPLEAIKIAKKTKMKLVMAAKIDIVDKEYFLKKIEPLIDNRMIKFIGEVGHKKKVQLLQNAKVLLAPINWREPFGLFLIESMACGTPVIAFKRGSVPEIIKDKKTGFIVKNVDEAVKSLKKIDQINRRDCRKWVEEKFTSEKMANDYEKIYSKVLKYK
ncbi:MAG: glycosyltransferase family 4 protein [Patescibacteria group bacterium]|nr:glycosyltransferase family 4 protein [Patescibacteria group bacterium]MBU1876777.1 glycosyltransferase family 4 protein [Patescibacteria group bacterium]